MKQKFNTHLTALKQVLSSGEKACFAWNQTGASYSSEIFARAGFNAVILDMEHGPFTLETAVQHCQALSAYKCTPFARVESHSPSIIKRVLDSGIYGLIIPQINSVEDATLAIAATKYPPQGIRGMAGSCRAAGFGHEPSEYFHQANNDIFVVLVIETVEAYNNLDAILALDGYDAIFIGPVDLASSMGYLGNHQEQEVQEAISRIETQVISSNKYLGTVSPPESAKAKYAKGYDFLTVLSDTVALSRVAHSVISDVMQV